MGGVSGTVDRYDNALHWCVSVRNEEWSGWVIQQGLGNAANVQPLQQACAPAPDDQEVGRRGGEDFPWVSVSNHVGDRFRARVGG